MWLGSGEVHGSYSDGKLRGKMYVSADSAVVEDCGWLFALTKEAK